MPAIIYVCIDPNLRPTTHNMRPYLCGINRRIHNKGTETDKKKPLIMIEGGGGGGETMDQSKDANLSTVVCPHFYCNDRHNLAVSE